MAAKKIQQKCAARRCTASTGTPRASRAHHRFTAGYTPFLIRSFVDTCAHFTTNVSITAMAAYKRFSASSNTRDSGE